MNNTQGNITYNITPCVVGQDAKPTEGDAFYLALRAFTLRKYGLTHKTYEAKHAAQDGVCAICLKPETGIRGGRVKRLSVDHSRATGRVRDLLCCRCNQAIGLMREDPAILLAAVAYIERHRAADELHTAQSARSAVSNATQLDGDEVRRRFA